jgi:hypothetical protein
MDFKGVRERARIHDRETSSHGAGRQQRVLLDQLLFASNPALPGASASDPLGHLFVSIPLSSRSTTRKTLSHNAFTGYLDKNASDAKQQARQRHPNMVRPNPPALSRPSSLHSRFETTFSSRTRKNLNGLARTTSCGQKEWGES